MKTITVCGETRVIPEYEKDRCGDCKEYVLASEAAERERVLVDIIEREASSLELFMHNKSSQSSHLKAIALRLRAALAAKEE